MLQLSIISQRASNGGIDLSRAAIKDILPIYKNALEDVERILDKTDNSTITKNEINILEMDLRQIVATLHDLRDNVSTHLSKNLKASKIHDETIIKSLKSIRSIEHVKEKIRMALDELDTASDMLDAKKSVAFRRCFRHFKSCLSQASTALILLEVDVEEEILDQLIIQVTSLGIGGEQQKLQIDYDSKDKRIFIDYNSENIRDLLKACFDDGTLTYFCFDHFREVHDAFTNTMDKLAKIQQLIEYCFRKLLTKDLLAKIEEYFPERYHEYKNKLIE
jgi:Effector-associated domain 7